MSLRDFAKLYFAFLLLQIAVIYRQDTGTLYLIAQPLLMSSLLVYLISRTENAERIKWWLLAAVFFALSGDISLMFQMSSWQITGLIFYSLMFMSYTLYCWFSYRDQLRSVFLMPVILFAALPVFIIKCCIPSGDLFYIPGALLLISGGIAVGMSMRYLSSNNYLLPLGMILLAVASYLQISLFREGGMILQVCEAVFYGIAHFLIMTVALRALEEPKYTT